jgi:hypothetical protein
VTVSEPGTRPALVDLEEEARTAYAEGSFERSVAAWERLHRLGRSTGDDAVAARGAAMVALFLFAESAMLATVRGWLTRARRHLAVLPDGETHAIVAMVAGYERFFSGDLGTARAFAGEPSDSARRTRWCRHRCSARC